MKICMIGLGSIGKKHLKNISKVLTERKQMYASYSIDALRHSKTELPEELRSQIQTEYYNYEDLPDDYDIIFVTNPTSKHFEAIQAVSHKTKAMFIEKPLFEKNSYQLQNLHLTEEKNYYVACPLRHKSILQYVKKVIDGGEAIYAARAISTSYLPEWRVDVDYRKVYSAQKELGGGVTLDLIHEWDYLTYFFGIPKKVYHLEGKYSELEMNCEDISLYIADYGDKTVEVHLDYVGRFPERKLELYCKDYRIDVDILQNRIVYHGGILTEDKIINFEDEDFYLNEMRYFFDMLEGKNENMNTIRHASAIMYLVICEEKKDEYFIYNRC